MNAWNVYSRRAARGAQAASRLENSRRKQKLFDGANEEHIALKREVKVIAKITRAAIAFASLLTCGIASAYTECPAMMLTKVWDDVDGNFFVATGGYLNGYISPTAKPAMAVAITAYTAGKPVIIRYGRDGVVCGSAAWNEQITAIGM